MTAVISGTNGLLQSYDYQTPTTGFTYTFAAGTQVLVMNPAGTLATGTITMPASPVDGMTITFSSSQQITALTMAGNGASINNPVTLLPAKTAVSYVYRATGTTWYPTATVPGTGSQLVQGTSVPTTSGTTVDITGIPSWVKRVTISFNGVSLSGTTPSFLLQLGYGATPTFETSGYSGNCCFITGGASTGVTAGNTTNAYVISVFLNLAADTLAGAITLTNFSGNTWALTGILARVSSGTNATSYAGGIKTISGGALSAVRLLHNGTTETFDAGSINILYE